MLLSPSPLHTPSPTSRCSSRQPRRSILQDVPLKRTRLSLPDGDEEEPFYSREFTVVSCLGRGDFGEVSSVISKKTGEKSAIKKYFLSEFKAKNGKNYSAQQMREVKLHKSLPPHPSIVHFQRAWRENGHLFLQMELCLTSLEGLWKERVMISERDRHTAMIDIMMGLDHLHTHGLLHLDIKPGNIMVTDELRCKIGDFSVAMDMNKDDPKTCEFGDKNYAAPELYNHSFTAKADIFSLGVMKAEISVPSSTPLSAEEWEGIQKRGTLPGRVAKELSGHFNMDLTVLSLINQDPSFRPELATLLKSAIESRKSGVTMFSVRVENWNFRDSNGVLPTCPSPCAMNNNRSDDNRLIFDYEEGFDECAKSKLRHSTSPRGTFKNRLSDEE